MLETRRTRRAFSPEFKLEAIGQVIKYQRDDGRLLFHSDKGFNIKAINTESYSGVME